jgi:hypothetical protein
LTGAREPIGHHGPTAAPRLVEHFFRREYGRLVAVLTRKAGVRHIDDAVQGALLAALTAWTSRGLPDDPGAWLYRAAHNNLIGDNSCTFLTDRHEGRVQMASIRKEIRLNVRPKDVWDAVRDVGSVHKRLCPGVLTDARLENDARIVTFANGTTFRELIVDIDDGARRFVWAAVGDPLTHHNASMQVLEEGDGRSRLVWITDILPNGIARDIQAVINQGADAITRTLEG